MPKKKKLLPKKAEPEVSDMPSIVNTNTIHNLLNVAISVMSVWALFDWTQFGLPQNLALRLIAACGLVKLTMNAARDGLRGMVEPQPPVSQK
jgi:hypothetical protein